MTDSTHTEDFSREAFMAAIVKLADDEAFRTSFLRHYQLWLHPPMIIGHEFKDITFNMRPGDITYLTDEQMETLHASGVKNFACINGVLTEIKDESRANVERIVRDSGGAP